MVSVMLRPQPSHRTARLAWLAAVALVTLVAALWAPGQARAASGAPAPFLYRPYYGTASVLSRSISLFDHDKPWYVNDGKMVRYDGQTFTNTGVTGCQPYISCYDGHNGYDINMFFEPVLAAGAGTVIRASWFNPENHLDGGGLWVAIDHGNGYVTMYCHLSAITATIGEQVAAQWQIGTSGSTGSASGPHLHFSVFQMPGWQPMDPFGWQSTTLADPNPTPDYYLWVGNPAATTQAPCLGCDNGQAHPGAVVVDDSGGGFSTTGAWQTASGAGMIGGGMRWAHTSAGAATATATWQPSLPATGAYEVGVYIDPDNASSQWVPYTITSQSAGGVPQTTTVWVDQEHVGIFQSAYGTVNTGPQWVGLGTYIFAAGSSAQDAVTVTNATGESNAQLGADAMEFVPVSGWSPNAPSSGTPTPVPTTTTGVGGAPAPTSSPTPPAVTPIPVPTVLPDRNRRHP